MDFTWHLFEMKKSNFQGCWPAEPRQAGGWVGGEENEPVPFCCLIFIQVGFEEIGAEHLEVADRTGAKA